jgi:hypothetical protein
MAFDSPPQPCPRCTRPTVLVTHSWGRAWIHLGTWRPSCDTQITSAPATR